MPQPLERKEYDRLKEVTGGGDLHQRVVEAVEQIIAERKDGPPEEWPPRPPVGEFVQTRDGGVWYHAEWGKFVSLGSAYPTDWPHIGGSVISHGTIHWRDAHGKIS